MQDILSGFLDQYLQGGVPGAGSNRKYVCPFHKSVPIGKKKLEINLHTNENGENPWNCHVCHTRGKTVRSLLWKMNLPKKVLDSLNLIIIPSKENTAKYRPFTGALPPEYVFLPEASESSVLAKHARLYLKKRNITEEDIIKYQIGFCDDGEFAERIIIPSFDKDLKINYFIARSFFEENFPKYKNPDMSRDTIPFEMYINWNAPIILCEGAFDMMAVKRNCIPLLGNNITQTLMKKLVESKIKKIYIALDNDALKYAMKHCETFLSYGKRVFLVKLQDKDPSKMGFEAFTELVQNVEELTFKEIIKLKLK